MSKFEMKRREFVAAAAVTAAVVPFVGCASGVTYYKVPTGEIRKGSIVKGRKINIACVGTGGMGRNDCANWADENVVALCDVDERAAKTTREKYPNAKFFHDYRQMLTEMDSQIDAVSVSTPDHMHFPVALMAVQMGKHVYVQKPLTHTIKEARVLREAAKIHEVKSQMGNQGHSNETTRLCKEWLDAGVIGDVYHVDIWTNRPIWPQGCELPKETQPIPAGLDWNLWLGVAPSRGYNDVFMPFKWRGWWDYGCGAIGDMGCHTMDAAFWALDLGAPTRVELVEIDGGTPWSPSKGAVVKFYYPARGNLKPCTMTWYEGTKKPPMPKDLEPGRNLGTSGQLFYGTKGVLHGGGDYCNSVRLIPETAMQAFTTKPPKTLPRVKGGQHWQNWLDAIRGNVEQACSNFDHGAPLAELGAIGNLAIHSGKSFDWDAKAMLASDPDVQKLVDKSYRQF